MRYRELKNFQEVGLVGSKAEWHAFPKEVYRDIKRRKLPLLRLLHDTISEDADLPMPPVRIEPFGWVSPDERSVVFGKMGPLPLKKGSCLIGVLMPASTLVGVDDESLLRRILCHEFSHCFWYVQTILQEKEASVNTVPASKQQQWTEVISEDKDSLARPETWLGKWDADHFLYYGDEKGHRDLDQSTAKVARKWISIRLPTKVPDLKFSIDGEVVIPEEIVDRIKQNQHLPL